MIIHYTSRLLATDSARRLGGTLVISFANGEAQYKVII